MILAVEGMDGAGKTTACEYISKYYDFKMIEKPTKYFFVDRSGKIDYEDFNKSLDEIYNCSMYIRALFFGMGNIFATRNKNNENLVLDRHLVSNYFWNGNEVYSNIFDSLVEKAKPTFTILLSASPKTRYERLLKRNPDDVDLNDEEVFTDGNNKMQYFLEKYGMSYAFIDTDKLTIEEVYERLDSLMNTLGFTKKEI